MAEVSNTPYVEPVTPITPSQATQIVQNYGIDPNQVLSADNIAQTIKAPAPAPDDLLGIRNQLYTEGGVNTAQTAYQAAAKAASSATLGLNERLTGLRGRAVSLSKITGTQAQERAVSQGEIDALNESARLAQADYIAKKGNADELFQIRNQEISEKKQIMLQYPGAKVSFGDSMEQVTKKLSDYQKKQEKDEYKKILKAKAMELGLKTSGSTSKLEKRISKASKAAIAQAKEEHDLKMESLRADIAKTKAGTGSGSSDLVPYYVTQPDGTIQQAMNDDGTPVMIPKNSQIFNVKANEDTINFGGSQQKASGFDLFSPSTWFNSWGSGY